MNYLVNKLIDLKNLFRKFFFIIYKMVYNEETKLSHYKWRETHKDQYRAYVNKAVKKHYEENKEELRKKKLSRYYYKKELKEFMNILI